MKLRLTEAVNKLNVEHRTPNIEHPILMTLRFIYFKTSEPPPSISLVKSNFEDWFNSRSAGACAACCPAFILN